MEKSIEEQLKEIILSKYGDMKTFSTRAEIQNSTLNSMFQRGILNCNIKNAIQLANALNISVDRLAEGKIEPKIYMVNSDTYSSSTSIYERVTIELGSDAGKVLEEFVAMNKQGRNLALQMICSLAGNPVNVQKEESRNA